MKRSVKERNMFHTMKLRNVILVADGGTIVTDDLVTFLFSALCFTDFLTASLSIRKSLFHHNMITTCNTTNLHYLCLCDSLIQSEEHHLVLENLTSAGSRGSWKTLGHLASFIVTVKCAG